MRVYYINDKREKPKEISAVGSLNQLLLEFPNDTLMFVIDDYEVDKQLYTKMYKVLMCSEHHGFVCLQNDVSTDSYIIMEELNGEVLLCSTKYLSMMMSSENIQITAENLNELAQKVASYGIQTVGVYTEEIVTKTFWKVQIENKKKTNRKRPSILFYIRSLPNLYNGSVVLTLGELDGLINALDGKYEMTICHGGFDTRFWGIDKKYPDVKIIPVDQVEEIYDVAILPTHTIDYKAQYILSRHALRWIVWPLDIIVLRRPGVYRSKMELTIKGMLEHADSLIVFSQSVDKDIDNYWPDSKMITKRKKEIITLPAMVFSRYDLQKCKKECPFERFILIFGNTILHKMIRPLVEHISSKEYNYIIVGWNRDEYICSNIYGYASGKLSNEYISFLYQECELMIFPSIYEGFGLPVINALNAGKDVLVQETYVNKEIGELIPEFYKHIHYFYSFENIDKKINEVFRNKERFQCGLYSKTWDDVGRQMVHLVDRLMAEEFNEQRYINRIRFYKKNNECYKESITEERDTFVDRIIGGESLSKIYGMQIVIYGFGIVGKLLAKELRERNHIVCILDAKPKCNYWGNIPVKTTKQYVAEKEDIIIITPVHDYLFIRDDLVDSSGAKPEQVRHLNVFLSEII